MPKTVAQPRIGGKENEPNGDEVAWTGGPEDATKLWTEPLTVDCLRPTGYRYKKQCQDTCEKGLAEELHLDLIASDKEEKVSITTWMSLLQQYVERRGMNTGFYVQKDGNWLYLFEAWGELKEADINARITDLTTNGDKYDKENLLWAHTAIRNSIGPNLRARIDAKEAQVTGIGLLFQILGVMATTNASIVRKLTDDLKKLDLSQEPKEDVEAFGERVTALCRRISGAGSKLCPGDLALIVAGLYLKTTVSVFQSACNQVYNTLDDDNTALHWSTVVARHTACYTNLKGQDQWPPELQNTKAMDPLQALTSRLDKLEQSKRGAPGTNVTCFKCGKEGHIASNCPERNRMSGGNGGRRSGWRNTPPAEGEPEEKTLADGCITKWCGKCAGGRGRWTLSPGLHSTAEHRAGMRTQPAPSNGETLADTSSTPSPSPVPVPAPSSNSSPAGNVAVVSSPSFRLSSSLNLGGFIGRVDDDHPSFCPPCASSCCHSIRQCIKSTFDRTSLDAACTTAEQVDGIANVHAEAIDETWDAGSSRDSTPSGNSKDVVDFVPDAMGQPEPVLHEEMFEGDHDESKSGISSDWTPVVHKRGRPSSSDSSSASSKGCGGQC